MRGQQYNPATPTVLDWLEFFDPDRPDQMWRINLTFLMSGYGCMFGQGCPGIHPVAKGVDYTKGCCHKGVVFTSDEDFDNVQKHVDMLTDEDWDKINHKGKTDKWYLTHKGKPVHTKLVGGKCIFSNDIDGPTGKPGCAFHHLADRIGVPNSDTMPEVCWMHPVRYDTELVPNQGELVVTTITAFDADDWGGWDKGQYEPEDMWEGAPETFVDWYCTDTPDAYQNETPLYQRIRDDMVKVMGQNAYDAMVVLIELRYGKNPTPLARPSQMPGEATNHGRPLLPLIVEKGYTERLAGIGKTQTDAG